jgi:hypothetical protein
LTAPPKGWGFLRTRRQRPQDGNDFLDEQRDTLRGAVRQLVVVFLLSYLFLFFGMSRHPNVFDEGIVLTGAMRVAAGQIPHRDFYVLYGPAQFYILAGLFKSFGESLLAERLFDLFIRALIVTFVYAIVSSYCRKSVAAFTSIITLLWLFSLQEGYGSPVIPVSLLNLVGSTLILPIFVGHISTRRMFAAGAVSGAAALFRYDTGVALAGIHFCAISIAVYFGFEGTSNRLRAFATTFGPYLLGFALLTLPAVVYYLSIAPVASLVHDIILYPAKYYHRGRNLPFPRIHLNNFGDLGIYLPIAIAGISLYVLVAQRSRAPSDNASKFQGIREEQEWRGFLVTFGLLVLVMYLKGFVRVSLSQMYLAIIPSLLLIAVLFQHRSVFPHPARITISCLMWLSLAAASWSARNEARALRLTHLSVPERILSLTQQAPPEMQTTWCHTTNPLTRGFCFLPEEDRIHVIEFIGDHTRPGQQLYVGLRNHERIFAADNLIYFATQRLPATKWSELDPDLENRYDIQTQMIHDLERNAPPYIVLDAEFESALEPNDSSKSSGVTLLDEYIHNKYQPIETFGVMSVWQRRHSP